MIANLSNPASSTMLSTSSGAVSLPKAFSREISQALAALPNRSDDQPRREIAGTTVAPGSDCRTPVRPPISYVVTADRARAASASNARAIASPAIVRRPRIASAS